MLTSKRLMGVSHAMHVPDPVDPGHQECAYERLAWGRRANITRDVENPGEHHGG
jgi:hypothetical protein